jgi:hypothetical protein
LSETSPDLLTTKPGQNNSEENSGTLFRPSILPQVEFMQSIKDHQDILIAQSREFNQAVTSNTEKAK